MISSNSCQQSRLLICCMSAPRVMALMANCRRSLVETLTISWFNSIRSSDCSFSSTVCIVSMDMFVSVLRCFIRVEWVGVNFRIEVIMLRSVFKVFGSVF